MVIATKSIRFPLLIGYFYLLITGIFVCSCLKENPVILPETIYDAKTFLPLDSLYRFDSVTITIMNEKDITQHKTIWLAPVKYSSEFPVFISGEQENLYLDIKGYKKIKGSLPCYKATSKQGNYWVNIDTCDIINSILIIDSIAWSDSIVDFDSLDTEKKIIFNLVGNKIHSLNLTPTSNYLLLLPPFQLDSNHKQIEIRIKIIRDSLSKSLYSTAYSITDNGLKVGEIKIKFKVAEKLPVIISHKDSSVVKLKVLNKIDSLPVSGAKINLDGKDLLALTDLTGKIKLDSLALGQHKFFVTIADRLGIIDSMNITYFDTVVSFYLPPKTVLQNLAVGWSAPSLANFTTFQNQAIFLSQDIQSSGLVLKFPLNNLDPRLQSTIEQGNKTLANPPEIFDAINSVADATNLYITYPDVNRIGKISDWQNTSAASNTLLAFSPYGLLLEGNSLFSIGRNQKEQLTLAEFNTTDFSIIKMDTLGNFKWDELDISNRGPKMVSTPDAFYVVDGNGPQQIGNLIKVSKTSRNILVSQQTKSAQISDICIYKDRIYITSHGSSIVEIYDFNLVPSGIINIGKSVEKISIVQSGYLQGTGFLTTNDNSVQVINTEAKLVIGSLSLPVGERSKNIIFNAAIAKLIVTTVNKIYIAEF